MSPSLLRSETAAVPSLFVIQGLNRGARYDLARHNVAMSIGREAGNFVQVDDNEVSRRHAEIRRVGEGFVVGDLKSSNGTYLNDSRIERAELANGDRIRIGRTILVFAQDGDAFDIGAVEILPPAAAGDGSRIVRSMREDDSIVMAAPEDPQGRWLSRARSNVQVMYRTALAVEDTTYYSAMVQSERLAGVGQTIATVSHHIKNILQGIRGGAYLVDMGLENGDEVVLRKGWDIVRRNQDKISSLVMDMLSFSKEREPEPVPSDLNELITEIVETVRQRAAETQAVIHWEPAADLPRLLFDPEGLSRAILNVVTNALDAVEGRPHAAVTISVAADREAGLVRVRVADNGAGMTPETLADIFNLFASTKGARGTGLGLTVSRKILREHGGEIHASSRIGEGSTFLLEFPLRPALDAPADPAGVRP